MRPENINDLRRFFPSLSTVFRAEPFPRPLLTAVSRIHYNRELPCWSQVVLLEFRIIPRILGVKLRAKS